jgi:hypothetical protein
MALQAKFLSAVQNYLGLLLAKQSERLKKPKIAPTWKFLAFRSVQVGQGVSDRTK